MHVFLISVNNIPALNIEPTETYTLGFRHDYLVAGCSEIIYNYKLGSVIFAVTFHSFVCPHIIEPKLRDRF
jgi:hypothetical protein